jgi:hypothetical protein
VFYGYVYGNGANRVEPYQMVFNRPPSSSTLIGGDLTIHVSCYLIVVRYFR